MFNIQGSEMIFLLLVALIILGPEKLPDAIRKFGRAYAEFKKMANGFQGELRQALDEPMRELKDTADMMRNAVNFDDDPAPVVADEPAAPPPPVKREQGLNFGSANPRRTTPDADAAAAATAAAADAEVQRPAGVNFGSANPRRPLSARDPLAADIIAKGAATPPAATEPATTTDPVAEPAVAADIAEAAAEPTAQAAAEQGTASDLEDATE